MGAWSEQPLGNDAILDDLYDFNIDRILNETDYYFGAYELGALVLDSLTDTEYAITAKQKSGLLKAINLILKINMIPDNLGDLDNYWSESTKAFLKIISMSIKDRMTLAKRIVNFAEKNNNRWIDYSNSYNPDCIPKMNTTYRNIMLSLEGIYQKGTKKAMVLDTNTSNKILSMMKFYENGFGDDYLKSLPDKYFILETNRDCRVIYTPDRKYKRSLYNKYAATIYLELLNNGKIAGTGYEVVRIIRSNANTITAYLLKDMQTGKVFQVSKDELKNAVASKRTSLINYKLTSDGRLIPRKR